MAQIYRIYNTAPKMKWKIHLWLSITQGSLQTQLSTVHLRDLCLLIGQLLSSTPHPKTVSQRLLAWSASLHNIIVKLEKDVMASISYRVDYDRLKVKPNTMGTSVRDFLNQNIWVGKTSACSQSHWQVNVSRCWGVPLSVSEPTSIGFQPRLEISSSSGTPPGPQCQIGTAKTSSLLG